MSQLSKKHPTTESTDKAYASSRVLIIDFGSQYTQLIARRVRELGVYSEVRSWRSQDAIAHMLKEDSKENGPCAIILSGGPESASVSDAPKAPEAIWDAGLPIMGICYGMQTIAGHFGGTVAAAEKREFGRAQAKLDTTNPLFEDLDAEQTVWMSHGDEVAQIPDGFNVIAHSDNMPVAAFANPELRYYGLQFHPEVDHTPSGIDIFRRFVINIAQCKCDWTAGTILTYELDKVRAEVGADEVVLGLSGGVDSSVAAALLNQAIGKQLHCIFVDTGLLRQDEGRQVEEAFRGHFDMDLHMVDAADKFFSALSGVQDPEDKRKCIGELFVRVFESEAAQFKNAVWLAQGTIYSDVIESARHKSAHLIKSHHNVGGLPEEMNLKLLEPLSNLFKDEVRKLGLDLGLPAELIQRHPFPGPGLAVRIIGEVTKESAELLRAADAIFIEELRENNLYDDVAQAFCVLLPIKSVAVMGDGRHYGRVVVLRAVETSDFMTARCARLSADFLDRVATRIVNEVAGISRVCYDISSKPPGTIEWE